MGIEPGTLGIWAGADPGGPGGPGARAPLDPRF